MSRTFPPPQTQLALQHDLTASRGLKLPDVEIVRQAALHERNRLDTVAETLVLLGLLFHCKVLGGNEVITVRGARFQWISGSASRGTQAAHCLPGWLNFNSIAIHELPGWTLANLQSKGLKAQPFAIKMRNLGARIDEMATVINTTDSSLEKMSSDRGLKTALRRSAYLLERGLFQRRRDHVEVVGDVVRDVMANYRQIASYACEERVDGYGARNLAAPNAGAAEAMRLRSLVAGTYLQVLQDNSVEPEAITKSGLADLLEDVLVAG